MALFNGKGNCMILSKIPDKHFEIAGILAGLLASVSICSQAYAEYYSNTASTISPFYALGFLFIFIFWTIYGIKFGRMAIWITNGIAANMQALLLVIIMLK